MRERLSNQKRREGSDCLPPLCPGPLDTWLHHWPELHEIKHIFTSDEFWWDSIMTSPRIYCWIANDPKADVGSLTASVCAWAHQGAPRGCNQGVGRACGYLTADRSGGPLPSSQPQGRDIRPSLCGPSMGLRVPGRRLPSEPASERGAPRTEVWPVCDLVSGVTSPHSAVLCGLRWVLGPASTPRGVSTGSGCYRGHLTDCPPLTPARWDAGWHGPVVPQFIKITSAVNVREVCGHHCLLFLRRASCFFIRRWCFRDSQLFLHFLNSVNLITSGKFDKIGNDHHLTLQNHQGTFSCTM